MLTKYLDPKNDVAFKKIFGTEKNKDILIHFLNDMITFKESGPIISVTFLKTVQDPEIVAKKTSIVDILCQDDKGNKYIVEMQVAKEKGFEKRAQFYASKAYISQAEVGGIYHDLKEVVFIAIADFIMFPNKINYKSDHVTLDKETFENDLKDFSFMFIELPKFTKRLDEVTSIMDKWCYFFKHAEETVSEDLQKLIDGDEIISRAFAELDRFSWNDEELLTYTQAEKYAWAHRASMEHRYEEGKKFGLAEGKELGLAEGKELGLLEGKELGKVEGERLATIAIAQKLAANGLSVGEISEITGLKEYEISSLLALN